MFETGMELMTAVDIVVARAPSLFFVVAAAALVDRVKTCRMLQ